MVQTDLKIGDTYRNALGEEFTLFALYLDIAVIGLINPCKRYISFTKEDEEANPVCAEGHVGFRKDIFLDAFEKI